MSNISKINGYLVEDSEARNQIENLNNELNKTNEYVVNVLNYGAIGDGTNDDTEAFINAIAEAKETNKMLYSPKGFTYLVNQSLDVSNLYINFNHSTIKTNENIDILVVNTESNYTNIENLTIDCNSVANSGLLLTASRRSKYNNLDIINVYNYGIKFDAGYENMFDNINMQTSEINSNAIGFGINSTDSHFTNICMTNLKTAFKITRGSNTLNKIHAWIGNESLINGSKMFDIELTSEGSLHMSNIYVDTYQYGFYYSNNKTCYLGIEQLEVQYNQGIYTTNCENSVIFNTQTQQQTVYTKINQGMLIGLSNGKTTSFCNRKWYGNQYQFMTTAFVETDFTFQINNVDSRINVEQNEIIKNGNTVNIRFIGSYNSSTTSGTIANFGKLEYYTAPNKPITSFCQISDSRWDFTTSSNGYVYIADKDASDYAFQLRLPSGSGTKYIFMNISYNVK